MARPQHIIDHENALRRREEILRPGRDSRIIGCWILPNGEVIPCLNNDHYYQAAVRFPDKSNPELYLEKLGALKVTTVFTFSGVQYKCDRELTQAQITELFKMGVNADNIEIKDSFS